MLPRRVLLAVVTAGIVAATSAPIASARFPLPRPRQVPATSLQTPEQFLGFRVGADTKLARWDKIVQYMQLVAAASDRVRVHELGKTTNGNPFISVEWMLQVTRTTDLPDRKISSRSAAVGAPPWK